MTLFSRSLLGGTVALAMATAAQAATQLTVYTAVESDDLQKYAERFNQTHPDIQINWVRDSTGVITARLLAEKDNPRADVIWGLAATSLLVLEEEGLLARYAPKGVEALDPKFVDPSAQNGHDPAWVGMDAWVAAICYNTIEGERLGVPMPTTWEDLTRPEYQGQVVMPNPSSSGTGYLDVASWMQLWGEEAAWDYMDRLHDNIARYTHSGSAPCNLAASGEAVVGISFAFRGARLKSQGAPIELVFPEEGMGWDMEAAAIVEGGGNREAAETLLDWAVSREANELYNEGYAVVAYPGVAQPIENYPEDITERMIDADFAWAAVNRERLLEEWQRRYDGKSESR
ncbi:putative 2-aminoethylphosphonate ABC transporter substrate-binding protein [Halomonas sp. MCCC 1A11036]|uniref:2-aminoethylphosphonate ABC transporter substrate-binding protein n=1 Tax=Billgrantia zhangzhouensis TaxID=2733481 RepID=A0ABS9AGN8_9GAMM|nr:putative 2-aminoethylphosphonate ABC transporter substrate-binding protein [Halomonas zhangzhouensis]MCE8020899.1 putative 2-aminoethylphosphonate ABC transporter substrate-binding protein [Halomonas zhangzhouensis]